MKCLSNRHSQQFAEKQAKMVKAIETWKSIGGYIASNSDTILVDRWIMGTKSSYRFALVSIVNGMFHYTEYKRTKKAIKEVIDSNKMK